MERAPTYTLLLRLLPERKHVTKIEAETKPVVVIRSLLYNLY